MENKDNKKIYMIIITVLLVIVGICIGYIVGVNNDNSTEQQNKTQEKTKSTQEEEKQNPNETTPTQTGTLESKGTHEEKEITLNEKKNTLVLENNISKDSVFTYGKTKLGFLTKWGTGSKYDTAPEKVEYTVIVGNDEKQYLVIYYQESFDKYLLVINDEAEIIGKYSSKKTMDLYDCFATLDDTEAPIYLIKEGSVYYYYIESEVEETGKAMDMELIKLEISNNKVKEIKTGIKATGKYSQCT